MSDDRGNLGIIIIAIIITIQKSFHRFGVRYRFYEITSACVCVCKMRVMFEFICITLPVLLSEFCIRQYFSLYVNYCIHSTTLYLNDKKWIDHTTFA